ncbi:MAG: AMP-binding protein [Gammaproteobacteria bacterium AqS3]|nr:AMP-binding protein [Gammaproteobacteria bacterium AqS3]
MQYEDNLTWSIGRLFDKWVIRQSEKTAVIFDDVPVSYGELNSAVNRLCRSLQAMGVKKGDRVAGMGKNALPPVALYLAAAKLGLVAVPINNRLVGAELAYQLNNCSVSALVFDADFANSVRDAVAQTDIRPERTLVYGGEVEASLGRSYDAVTGEQPDTAPVIEEPVNLMDPLAIIYTSGTTGAPKGAVTNHLQTYFKFMNIVLGADLRQDDVMLAPMPLFHSAGLFICLTPMLLRGGSIVTRKAFDPALYVQDCRTHRPTLTVAITTMFKMIMQHAEPGSDVFSSLRYCSGGGERTPQSLLDELQDKFGMRLRLGFGQTENSAMAGQQQDDIGRVDTVGRAGFFSDIWIENPEGERLPPDSIGRIMAQGPTVMSGYWEMPEKTAETIRNGVLNTGDLGTMDAVGRLALVDREKDMYRSGGENVYPAEIEKLLMDHPKVFNAAVIGVADEEWGEVGRAFVVARPGETVAPQELLDHLDGRLAKFKWPRQFEMVDALPMTESGKVKKAELKQRI